jgi:SAM-dependent methyltransferase
VLESFQVQRRLLDMGYEIHRYSGLAFKVVVRESDGSPRGLDVFGGFMLDGRLYLMGEVGHRFRPEWIEPRSEVTLAGRTYPAPAEPDHLLEAMYGPSWRVPDPAFKFTTPLAASRRLNGWFRGTRVGLDAKWARFSRGPGVAVPEGPSAFVQWAAAREQGPEQAIATAVDIGCGTGGDVLWLASQGIRSWGLDYFPRGFRNADQRARKEGLDARFEWANLNQLRSVLASGAILAREPGPRIALARHVTEHTDAAGRENLLRLARMTVGHSGRLYLQARAAPPRNTYGRGSSLDELVARTGGTVEEAFDLADDTVDVPSAPTAPTTLRRMVIAWHRRR